MGVGVIKELPIVLAVVLLQEVLLVPFVVLQL